MKKYLVTGATGFVGGAVARALMKELRQQVTVAVRRATSRLLEGTKQVIVGDLAYDTDYVEALQGMDVVIHAAARAHILKDTVKDPLLEFRKVNVEGTLNFARQAAEAGVKRFVFISSIGVNGNNSMAPFIEKDSVNPQDAYAISKYEAELGLEHLSKETGMEIVIIRPPLVYGSNAPGNFSSLVQWVAKSIPLPLGSVCNQRSFIALDNLVDFIMLCAEHPKAANETFLISDGEDVSTTELLQKVAKALGKKARLVPVSVGLMTFVVKLLGKGDVANRLFGSLQVDSSKARELLDWKPVITMDEQLRKLVEVYK